MKNYSVKLAEALERAHQLGIPLELAVKLGLVRAVPAPPPAKEPEGSVGEGV